MTNRIQRSGSKVLRANNAANDRSLAAWEWAQKRERDCVHLRKKIVELMKTRAMLTGKSHAAEWAMVDREISALQRRVDTLTAQKD